MKIVSVQQLQQDVTKALAKKIIRLLVVKEKVGLSRSAIYDMMKKGAFPKCISLSDDGRAVGWLETDIDSWIDSRISISASKAAN